MGGAGKPLREASAEETKGELELERQGGDSIPGRQQQVQRHKGRRDGTELEVSDAVP